MIAEGPLSHEGDDDSKQRESSAVRVSGDASTSENVSPFDSPTATFVDTSNSPTAISAGAVDSARAHQRSARTFQPAFELQNGSVIANRYKILAALGQGGMGAVYKAEDIELNRLVALKVIRADMVNDGDLLQRFKQEILLASKITDRHIVRIFDLGEGEGFKFITMEYIEGQTLSSILSHGGKLPVDDTVGIVRQILQGLESAHRENIIHRDLKPANIMRDIQGRVVVMDFGLARTVAGDGMTGTGLVVGTMEYMSPEQAQSLPLDVRSDIFSVGLIFYELLTGKSAFPAESAIASLVKRTRERAIPACEVDPAIPQPLSRIVSRCLESQAKFRYANVHEALFDLEHWQDKTLLGGIRINTSRIAGSNAFRWSALIVVLVALAGGGFLLRNKLMNRTASSQPATAVQPEVSLAILPFRNSSNDASLDWLGSSLADMLSTDIGQSGRLRTVSPDQVHQILADLRMTPGSAVDPTALRRIAEYSNADTVIWGQYARFGNQIRIDATIRDFKHDRQIPLNVSAPTEADVPSSIDKLAGNIRQNLAISPDVLKELKVSSFQPTSASLDALRQYQEGVESFRAGKYLEAAKHLEGATSADPQFALAFSRLAQCYSNLGYDDRAEQASRRAVALSDNLPSAEKYLILAVHASITKDFAKAIAAYEELLKAAPDNTEIQFALAGAYENSGDFTQASVHYKKVLDKNPKDISALLATGRVAIKSGDTQASLEPLNRALSLAVQLDNQEQKALILQALGIAYARLNKPDEALRNYEQSMEIKKRLGQKKGVADSLNMIAEAYDVLGKPELALANYNDALKIYREIGDRQDVGNDLLNLGQFYHDRGKYDDALKYFKESLQILRDVGDKNNEGLCLNNIGNTYTFIGDYDNARTYFEQALALEEKTNVPTDIADTLHNLGEVAMKTGQYDKALSQYLRALDLRRQAADKVGSAKESDSLGILFAYEGRYGAALNARKDAMNGFRDLGDRSYWMAETLGGYGYALAQVGQYDEAKKNFEEALNLARVLKNQSLEAQIIAWQGDSFSYQGDNASAEKAYQQAAQLSSKSTDHDLQLELKLKLAILSLEKTPTRSAIATVQHLADQAGSAGLKYLALEGSLAAADGAIRSHNYSEVSQSLESVIATSEKLGARPLLARSHFLMGMVLHLSGSANAAVEYQQAIQIVQEMQKDAGAKFTERSDIKSMLAEAGRFGATS